MSEDAAEDRTEETVYYRVVVTPGRAQVSTPTAESLIFSFKKPPTYGEVLGCLSASRATSGQSCFEILHLQILAVGAEALVENVYVSCAGQIVGSVTCAKQYVIDNSKE